MRRKVGRQTLFWHVSRFEKSEVRGFYLIYIDVLELEKGRVRVWV